MTQRLLRRLALLIVNAVSSNRLLSAYGRATLLRRLGIEVGHARIDAGSQFHGFNVRIADGCYVNEAVFFDGSAAIDIGPNVSIEMQCVLLTGSHEIGNTHQRARGNTHAGLTIGEGSWLGARVVVLPGVQIGAGCVIATGSVVTKSTTPNSLYAGVPATKMRDLPN
jgi:maltose O-acetyltransferase